jgi:hypothetical protein
MYGPASDGPYISPFHLVLNRFHKSRTNFAGVSSKGVESEVEQAPRYTQTALLKNYLLRSHIRAELTDYSVLGMALVIRLKDFGDFAGFFP